jgi:hypothetical protein
VDEDISLAEVEQERKSGEEIAPRRRHPKSLRDLFSRRRRVREEE